MQSPTVEPPAVLVEIPPGYAVLQRDDHGLLAQHMVDVLGDLIQVMGLEREQDQVLGAGL